MLPGSTFEEIQQIPVGLRKRKASITSTHSNTMDQKVVLIFFLGGVTYAEIAALRFLSQQEDGPADYIIATTKLINGKTWLEAIMENVVPEEGNPFLM
ncbi:vacuolar protein sorting-associated protein 33A-like [Lingula anatina]|nr:vacuolar protein sorting-associated protein 33A-like [Lingula anatina]|eukprot:XP_013379301.1 vacuolar protein sorting-associated protein 33A-like [Lingula anatina]